MKSYVKTLHVKNVKQFEEINVAFNKGFNFITGPNGSGKTTLLACISHCFSASGYHFTKLDETSELWSDVDNKGIFFRVGTGAGSFLKSDYRQNSLRQNRPAPVEAGYAPLTPQNVIQSMPDICPLVIGPQRNIRYQQVSGMQKEMAINQKINQVVSQNLGDLYGESNPVGVKQWLINRYFIIDKEWVTYEKSNWEHLLSNLPKIAPFNSQFKYIRTGRDLEPIFSVHNKECYLEELSSGYQAILYIIIKIIDWVETRTNERDREIVISSGTVLIDELDMHLHPEWQFSIRAGLELIFPNLQFIITTHSPHLLSTANENEIIRLTKYSGKEERDVSASKKKYSGWTTDQILEEVMGVTSLENTEHQMKINNALNLVETGSPEELATAISELDNIVHPNDTIVSVLKAKLATKVLLSDD